MRWSARIATAVCCLIAMPALGYPIKTTVGKTVEIGKASSWGSQCEPGAIPWLTITKKPSNGTLNTEVGEYVLKHITTGSTGCIGKKVKGVILYYTPNSSFRGADSVNYYVDFSSGRRFDYTVEIDVGAVNNKLNPKASETGAGKPISKKQ